MQNSRTFWFAIGLIIIGILAFNFPKLAGMLVILVGLVLGFTAARKQIV